jgi:hypothetical protein
MNAAASKNSIPRWEALKVAGYPRRINLSHARVGEVGGRRSPSAFFVVGLGVGAFGGYFQRETCSRARVSVSFQLRRLNAQATSGDVQSRTGTSSYCERSKRRSFELPVLFGFDRAVARIDAAPAAFACNVAMHVLRPSGAIHRWRRVTTGGAYSDSLFLKNIAPGMTCRGRLRCGGLIGGVPRSSAYPHPAGDSTDELPAAVQSSTTPPAGEHEEQLHGTYHRHREMVQ